MLRYTRLSCAVVVLLLVSFGDEVSAATATATISVTATVLSACTITSQPLPFGNYSSAAVTGSTTLTVTCTLLTPYSVALNAGTGTGATVTTRKMTNGTSNLSYSLTSDAAHLINIGQTIGTDVLTGIGTGTAQTLTVYGIIPASQNVSPGNYTDTVTATLTY